MTSSVVEKIILKFNANDCLDYTLRAKLLMLPGQLKKSGYCNGLVYAWGNQCFWSRTSDWHSLYYYFGRAISYPPMPSKQNLAPSWIVAQRFFEAGSICSATFQKMAQDDGSFLQCFVQTKPISHFQGLSSSTTAEFEQLKISKTFVQIPLDEEKVTMLCVDLSHQPLSGPFSSTKWMSLIFKLLVLLMRDTPICNRIASFLALPINISCKTRLLYRMTLYPILLEKWKISCAVHLMIITSWFSSFVMLGHLRLQV